METLRAAANRASHLDDQVASPERALCTTAGSRKTRKEERGVLKYKLPRFERAFFFEKPYKKNCISDLGRVKKNAEKCTDICVNSRDTNLSCASSTALVMSPASSSATVLVKCTCSGGLANQTHAQHAYIGKLLLVKERKSPNFIHISTPEFDQLNKKRPVGPFPVPAVPAAHRFDAVYGRDGDHPGFDLLA
jgi:hypothetical protein